MPEMIPPGIRTSINSKAIDFTDLLPNRKSSSAKESSNFKPDFDPLQLRGLIGDTVRWINKYAIFEEPLMALLAVLAFAGAVFGRRYCSPLNTRTNIYLVSVCRTASGKDHARKMLNFLADKADLRMYLGGNSIRSESGLLRGLMNNASQLLMLDEFGMFLQLLSDSRAASYLRAIIRALISLYSDSANFYDHGEYADPKNKKIYIRNPNLCIYGTTTEESYIPALNKRAISSGELNRFITIKIPFRNKPPRKEIPFIEMDDAVLNGWKSFAPSVENSISENMNSNEVSPSCTIVQWTQRINDLRHELLLEQEKKVNSDVPAKELYGRYHENIIKIAMIFAIARNGKEPEFSEEDFKLAQPIVMSSISYQTSLAENHMAESPQEEHQQEVLKALKEAGGKLSLGQISKRFRKIKRRDLSDALQSLIEQEEISASKEGLPRKQGGGRAMTVYRLLKP